MKILHDLTPRLDPELARQFARVPVPESPPDLAAAREGLRLLARQLAVPVLAQGGFAIEDRTLPGPGPAAAVPVRIYRPVQGGGGNVVLFIHGGGFIAGHHEDADVIAPHWVRECGCTVVSAGYRLAPEHPFPAGLDDCEAALRWIVQSLNPRRFALGGMSAGGALAASLAQCMRDTGGPAACLQMLLVPVIDHGTATESFAQVADPRVWNRRSAGAAWNMYVDPARPLPAYAAPGALEDLSDLPPCYVEVAEVDSLADEGIAYARRLMRAGVMTELHVYPGAYHASTVFDPDAAVSRRALADCTAALARAFA